MKLSKMNGNIVATLAASVIMVCVAGIATVCCAMFNPDFFE